MVPDDSGHTKYFLGNRVHSKIRVAVWRAPITGKPPPGRVVDELERPTQLGNDVGIRQCGHVWMGPSMHSDIILILEGSIEFLPITDDIHPNVEVGRLDLILLKESVESIGRLYNT
jgi:hypothetical protein